MNNILSNLELNPGVCISAILSIVIFLGLNIAMYLKHRSFDFILIIAPICITLALLLAPVGAIQEKGGGSDMISGGSIFSLVIIVIIGIAILLGKEDNEDDDEDDDPPTNNKKDRIKKIIPPKPPTKSVFSSEKPRRA